MCTDFIFCSLFHICVDDFFLNKIRACILLAVNVNINPHQELRNPAVISLKLKQIINFVNRAED